MTVKEKLHKLIDEMHEDQAAVLLMDLEEHEPLSEEDRKEISAGLADAEAGRVFDEAEVLAEFGIHD